MGCNSSLTEDTTTPQNKQCEFTVKIHMPNADTIRTVSYTATRDRLPITDLINYLFSTAKTDADLDANFISVKNKTTDSFEYYIQRLVGYETDIEETPAKKGRASWNFYLNGNKTDWTNICTNNKVIFYLDELELRYETTPSGQ